MSNLKRLRTRIKSIKATSKITKAMQLVAANKLNKIKYQLGEASHYLNTITNIAQNISSAIELEDLDINLHKYFFTQSNNIILVIFTSDKGLCGSFNSQIIKNAKNDIKKFLSEGKTVNLIILGNKGYIAFKNEYHSLIKAHFVGNIQYSNMSFEINNKIVETIESLGSAECYIYFNRFKNSMIQIFNKIKLLPLENNKLESIKYEYENKKIIENLVNLYINSRINIASLETKAGEEGARMTAMDSATKNANTMADNLNLELNRKRQSIITKDLIEIIAGAENV